MSGMTLMMKAISGNQLWSLWQWVLWNFTSLHELSALVHQVVGHLVISHKLLEAEAGQASAAQVKVGGQAQQGHHNGVVDVEARRHERQHVHVTTHDLQTHKSMKKNILRLEFTMTPLHKTYH